MVTEIYLNNKFLGVVDNGKAFVEDFRESRRKGTLDPSVNVCYDKDNEEIHIESTGGRAQRPLLVLKDGKILLEEKHLKQLEEGKINWKDLVKQGMVEFLDALEEENALVAYSEKEITPKHTHLEISPSALCGIVTSLVPFANFNQPPRLIIGSKNQKQSLGFYAGNYPIRLDMDISLLHYPQVPIIRTKVHDLIHLEQHPAGQNVVLAIMSYDGYTIEDALVINRSSLDRGLYRSTYFRPVETEELRYSGGLVDEICIPDKDVKGYRTEHEYRLLEEDGIIFPEAKAAEGDVVIGKTSPPRFLSSLDEYNLSAGSRRESATSLSHGEQGVADLVIVTENEEGNRLVRVRLREEMVPELGDKFTSRHGQKGVVGLVVPQADMPFSASGVVPDIIFSPHGIPSRMTISHLLEMIGGKVAAMNGRIVEGTIFEGEPEEKLRQELLSLGFREDGTEEFYHGRTGKKMEARIFVGHMHFLRLKYLAANKLHSRARGPVQLLTRQPTEGKAKEGGLRLGEMEKDTFIAHGAALLLKERFDSDKTLVCICERCGLPAVEDRYKNRKYCPVCGEGIEVNYIEVSYAFKLLLDELKSLGISPSIKLKSKY